MKSVKMFTMIASLCTAFVSGCMTEPTASDPDSLKGSTSSVEQDIGGGGGGDCTAWSTCYQTCRRFHVCDSPAGCDALTACLNSCDSSYPSAPGSCPYPQ
ncbi:MAG TPA: hypothetical protein VFT22_13690 [Kofleriaceae bacterium]|nr:hypothetical protein [Kofleriaceae bacterium]